MLTRGALPDPEIIPTANLGRDHTFLTAMNVENNDIFNESGQVKRPDSGYMKTSSVMKGFGPTKMSQASREGDADDASPGFSPQLSELRVSP